MTSSCGGLWYFHNAELLQVPYSGFASPNFQRWVPTLWCNTQENNICPEMWKTGRDVDWSNILMSTQFWKNFQNWRLLFIFTTLLIKNKAMRVRLTEAGCMDQNNRVVNCWVELWLVFSLHFICIWHKNIYRKCVSAVYRYLNQWDWHTDGTEHLCGLFKKKKILSLSTASSIFRVAWQFEPNPSVKGWGRGWGQPWLFASPPRSRI